MSADKKDKKKKRSGVVSSDKRDPKKSIDYWTDEQIEKAKPVPFPKSKPKRDDDGDSKRDD